MPHLFVNRVRLHNLTGDDRNLRRQFRWETINAVVYKLGGLLFIAGSVLFFPAFGAFADLGVWIFFAGSLLYLLVTGHDALEVRRARRAGQMDTLDGRLEIVAAWAYFTGTVLFTVGSIFFLSTVGLMHAGAWCFVIGSLLFVLGACINVLQIVKARSLISLQLMNLTAVTFVVGSVLFTVASVPYLWTVADQRLHRTLLAFLAAQYLVGSVLFLAGGVFNYWRAYQTVSEEIAKREAE